MYYSKLDEFLREDKVDNIAEVLANIYQTEPQYFYSRVITEGYFPSPVKYDYDENICIINSFEKAIPVAKKILVANGTDGKLFEDDCLSILNIILVIRKNFLSNSRHLAKCEFFKLPRGAQVQTILAHIQGLHLQLENRLKKSIQKDSIFTGLERDIATLPGIEKKNEFSMSDALDSLIEFADDLLRYIFHLVSRSKLKEGFIDNVNPSETPGYSKALHLAQGHYILNLAWEKVKYRDWRMEVKNSIDREIMTFVPSNQFAAKIERASTIRYSYKAAGELFKMTPKTKDVIEQTIKYIDSIAVSDPSELFKLKKHEIAKARKFIAIIHDIAERELAETLPFPFMRQLIGPDKSVKVSHLLEAVKYLNVLACVYERGVVRKIERNGSIQHTELAPIINLNQLVRHFADIHAISIKEARSAIELLVFQTDGLDLYSQPLVPVGNDEVAFCPHIITVINIARIVNQHLSKWGIDVASKGNEFEKRIRSELVNNLAKLVVASKSMKINNVQYDGLAILKDNIIIMEMKCLKQPYDPIEYYYLLKELTHAAEQLEIRAENIKNNLPLLHSQWPQSKVVSEVSDKNIVKVIVLNVLNFTGLKIGDAYITDYSSFNKFFLHPVIEQRNASSIEKIHAIWEDKQPAVGELLEYLGNPIQTKYFVNELKECFRPAILVEKDDYPIQLFDFNLNKAPEII